MNKIWIILQREYLTRITKNSFIITTLLVPILMGLAMFIMIKVSTSASEHLKILVMDESGYIKDKVVRMNKGEHLVFINESEDISIEKVKQTFAEKGFDGLLFIPTLDIEHPNGIKYYSNGAPGLVTQSHIEDELDKILKESYFILKGIDPKYIESLHTPVKIQMEDISGIGKSTEAASIFGYISGLLIYVYLLFFGSMVMRGVAEEKTSRIIEVVISSVKPFQLMMGKILGIGMVGLTQFIAWIILGTGITSAIGYLYPSETTAMNQANMAGNVASNPANPSSLEVISSLTGGFSEVDIMRILLSFVFFFIFGYIFYAAQFAAIGAAVTDEGDTQSLSFPVTIPIIISIFLMATTLSQPNSSLAIWSSMIPFSAPIVMMARIPFGISWGQQIASMIIMVISSLTMVWIAGRIYRIGILIQGKKVKLTELLKWTFQRY
ncbi:MAG: ABC transporter permease [Chitinophagales bacterium]|nr:ABC transporter permease [Chitinophagales bacterium]